MKARCSLISVVVLFAAGVLTTSSYGEFDPETCVGVWLFDEGEGDIAADSSGKGNDGELIGGPAWVDGKFGSALEFDGASSYVSVPDSESLNPTTAITLGAWIYPKGFTDNGNGLLTKEGQYILGLNWPQGGNAQKLNLWLTIGSWILFASEDEVPADSWSHVAVTYDGSAKKLYINGNLVDLGVFNGADRQGEIGTSANDILIAQGNTGVGGQAFKGLIDEIAVFNVALTESDIKDFMTGWSFLLAVTPASKLTTTWAAIRAYHLQFYAQ